MQNVEFEKQVALYKNHPEWRDWLLQGKFGLELEINRVKINGSLSHQPYPDVFGDRQTHPFLKSDYSEGMFELVTSAQATMKEARTELGYLINLLRDELGDAEMLWPLSLPPRLGENDLDWLDQTFERFWLQEYRDHLKQRYGSAHAIISGPHINFSLSTDLLEALFALSQTEDQTEHNNQIYFKFAQGIDRYRWLFIYLFGSSPIALDKSDWEIPNDLGPVRSLRNSIYGYVNSADVEIDPSQNFEIYTEQIAKAIKDGRLFSNHEYYGTVRFKGADEYQTLLEQGINYLELRVIDTNPFDEFGLSLIDLEAVQLILLWIFISNRDYSFGESKMARQQANIVALQYPDDFVMDRIIIKDLLDELIMINDLFDEQFTSGLEMITERLLDPTKTPAAKLMQVAPDAVRMQDLGTKLGLARQRDYLENDLPETVRTKMRERLRGTE